MTAPQFFVESLAKPQVRLSPEDSRHALRALRLRSGEEVTMADGRGGLGRGRMVGEEDGRAVVRVEEVRTVTRPRPHVSVALAPPKGDRLSWAVQKLSEVGVDEVVLVRAERSVRTWDEARGDRVRARLEAVAREAAMQSRQPFVMAVRVGGGIQDEVVTGDRCTIVLWEEARERLSDVVPDEVEGIRLVVGPEGGLPEEEVRATIRSGARAASLGDAILRTETAALVGATLVLARYGRIG